MDLENLGYSNRLTIDAITLREPRNQYTISYGQEDERCGMNQTELKLDTTLESTTKTTLTIIMAENVSYMIIWLDFCKCCNIPIEVLGYYTT